MKLPGPAALGPYPTVVEYSGYDPSNPDGHAPASTIAQALGYATVGVNLRGTGCSGGAWRYFEPLQSLDGYDVIETIAAQPWVANGKVGMVGISYPGITQLFVAQTRPPHLAAITPLSVIDDTYQTLYPGGIPNDGFSLGWAKDRSADAAPSGQRWAASRIANGDKVCEANQALRLQSPNVLSEIESLRYYDGARADALAPATFVDKINVPVFLAGVVAGRRDRRALRQHARRLRARCAGEVHAHERRAQRLARARRHRALGRVPRLLRRTPHPDDPE